MAVAQADARGYRSRASGWRVLTLACTALMLGAGCTAKDTSPALERYASTTLEAGTGLGDLRLGTTTLQQFIERFGTGRPSVVIGDEPGLELGFRSQGLSFLFIFDTDCATALGGETREVATRIEHTTSFFADYPACADTTLSSLSIDAESTGDVPFYAGASDRGVRLLVPLALVQTRYLETADLRGLMLAGSTAEDGRLELLTYADGLAVHLGEARTGAAAGRFVVLRMSVFLPPEG